MNDIANLAERQMRACDEFEATLAELSAYIEADRRASAEMMRAIGECVSSIREHLAAC